MTEELKKTDEKQTEASKEKKRKLMGIEPKETKHELKLKKRSLSYTARAGVLPLKNEYDEIEAEIFFTAYELDGVDDRANRPLTFVFNGGPGSSSIWLHMGAVGPKRVRMEKEGWMPSPPYRLEKNQHTWLDQTDLVCIDPVGTGYSRSIKPEVDQKYWNFKGDIESVGEFIRLYLSRYQRWTSPLFLAGESYGTTRAAGLAGYLVDKGISFNGIILISTALDLRPIFFRQGDDLPFQLFVPTYCATAYYHKKLSPALLEQPLKDLMKEVEDWSKNELTVALMKGDQIGEEERQLVAEKLSIYTGLGLDFILGSNLRIDIYRFCKELLRSEKRSVGRLDSRYKGVEALAVTERPEYDPASLATTPPYTSTFNQYVCSELGIETDMTYEVISEAIAKNWEWDKGSLPTTGEVLRGAMAKNPFMKVLVCQGYFDLATPHLATEYMISHMNIDPALRDNVKTCFYNAGHMFYLDAESHIAFKTDVDEFIRKTSG